jgi:hypothetical protein
LGSYLSGLLLEMKFSGDYTRIAVPWGINCPHCKTIIHDWHLEWYDNQTEITKWKKPADCPVCRQPVYLSTNSVYVAPLISTPKLRSIQRAEMWAINNGLNLEEYLETEGSQYRNYWEYANVDR